MKSTVLLLLTLMIALAGCTSADAPAASTQPDPAPVVINYLTAKANTDEAGIRANLCSEMESLIPRETASFSGVDASLEDAVCQRAGESDVVTCTGEFVLVYGGQDNVNRIPLTAYRVVLEDGEWKWCGETAPPAAE